uniref:Uncharacterized protein n=1 Tax=Lotus japonicus TaxID=34305 RepID=I3T908_LOTJA|nr:unknown [Lotus japonicus]
MERGACNILLLLMFLFFSKLLLDFLSFKLDRSFRNLNVVMNLMEVLSAMLSVGVFQIC